jgi:chemotaxis protein histidine kinase CheA
MNFSEDQSDFNPSKGWAQYVPSPGHLASAGSSFLAKMTEEVSRQLEELHKQKREGELRVTRRVSDVALDCARALDGMERQLAGVAGDRQAEMETRLQELRRQVYTQLAEALDRARGDLRGESDLPLN